MGSGSHSTRSPNGSKRGKTPPVLRMLQERFGCLATKLGRISVPDSRPIYNWTDAGCGRDKTPAGPQNMLFATSLHSFTARTDRWRSLDVSSLVSAPPGRPRSPCGLPLRRTSKGGRKNLRCPSLRRRSTVRRRTGGSWRQGGATFSGNGRVGLIARCMSKPLSTFGTSYRKFKILTGAGENFRLRHKSMS